MLAAELPSAIAHATGLPEYWIAQVLRHLREADLIPSGRFRPPFTGLHVARVLLGLASEAAHEVPVNVRAIEAAPARSASVHATAGEAIASLVDGLASDANSFGSVEVSRDRGSVSILQVGSEGAPVTASFGASDPMAHRLASTTLSLPLAAVKAVAAALQDYK